MATQKERDYYNDVTRQVLDSVRAWYAVRPGMMCRIQWRGRTSLIAEVRQALQVPAYLAKMDIDEPGLELARYVAKQVPEASLMILVAVHEEYLKEIAS